MMIGHTEPSAYAVQMANHRDAMRHARLIALRMIDHQAERAKSSEGKTGYVSPENKPMTTQRMNSIVRGLLAEFMASMPRPAEAHPHHEPMPADGPAVSLPNGWGPIPNADLLADPHLIKA